MVILINLINVIFAISKDAVMAAYLGTSKASDIFFLSFFIPDMLGNNLVAVSLGVAAVPLFAKCFQLCGIGELFKVYKKVLWRALLISAGLALIMILGASTTLQWLGKGFETESLHLAVELLYIMIPTVMLYPLITVSMSLLQVMGHYWESVVAAVLPNGVLLIVVSLLGLKKMPPAEGIVFLAVGVVLAISLEMLYLGFYVPHVLRGTQAGEQGRDSLGNNLVFDFDQEKESLFRKFTAYGVLLLLSQMILYYERYLGSTLNPGSISAISYAYRLSQFPVLVFSYSVALIAFPEMSKVISVNKSKGSSEIYQNAFRNILRMSIPVAIGMSILREPLVTILFNRYAFDQLSVQISGSILCGYVFAVIGQGIILLNIRVLVALGNMKIPILTMFSTAIVNMMVDRFLVNWLGISGIGWGALIGASAGALMLTGIVMKRLEMKVVDELTFMVKMVYGNSLTLLTAVISSWLWSGFIIRQVEGIQFIYGLLSGVLICSVAYLSLKRLKAL